MKNPVGRPRRGAINTSGERQAPRVEQIERLRDDMARAGERPPELHHTGTHTDVSGEFKGWLKRKCEQELWFLSRWLLENDWLGLGSLHRAIACPFLTDFTRTRSKLLMLPMGHLKTTIASRSLPIHVLIQPIENNRYFKGRPGKNARILLANESEEKSKENLSYVKTHLESNDWLYWLWPDVIWENCKAQAPRWSDRFIEVKRSEVWAEPSVTAIGVKSGFVGRYFDIMVADDLAALEASQSPPLLERAKKFRRALRTRLYNKEQGIIVGVGTEWPACDLYAEWEKDPTVEVMIKSIVDNEDPLTRKIIPGPLWPEKYPVELIDKMREQNDAIEWAAWYMNRRVGRGVTALDWHLLRQFEISEDGLTISFLEASADRVIALRKERIASNLGFTLGMSKYDPANAPLRKKPPRGMEQEAFDHYRAKYPDGIIRQVLGHK